MTIATAPLPWPREPLGAAKSSTRLAWYAAVARWAPSKHNTQPWRFEVGNGSLEFWPDQARMLPETDPDGREMTISIGAAVQLASIGARAHGFPPEVALLPDGAAGCLARLVEAAPSPATEHDLAMLAAIPVRRTDRGPLDAARLDPGLPFRLQAAASSADATLRLVSTPGDRLTLAALVERADRQLAQRGEVQEELAGWVRDPGDSRADGVPSDHTRGAAASYRAQFVQRDFSVSGTAPAQDRPGTDNAVIGVLCTAGDRRADWLTAGRALAEVLLSATIAGGNASYLNQPVEIVALRAQLREDLELTGVPQLVLRIGAGGDVTPTPRRPADEVIVHV